MKKILIVMVALVLTFAMTACSSTDKNTGEASPSEESSAKVSATEESKGLVVYFSWSGNTENVANSIKDQTGSDIFEIVPQTPYSDDYDTVVDLAQEEQSTDARPKISGSIDNLEQYDVIYVGYPNWWGGDMPMILYTFFDTYDLSGKRIVPFVTSGGSGFSNTIGTIEGMEPDAEVLEGLSLSSSQASDPDSDVTNWLNDLGLVK